MFIDISDIKKSYGAGESRVEVLKGISFGVEKGEFCVLLDRREAANQRC